MIKDFLLRNYRKFQTFRIDALGQVNVFVGKNNAGKTSLLEALYLYSMGVDVDVLQNIAARRGELVFDSRANMSYQVDYSHFFNGHKIKNDVSLQLGTDANCFRVRILPYSSYSQVSHQNFFPLDPEPVEEDALYQFLATITQTKGDNADKKMSEISLTTEGVAVRHNRIVNPSAINRGRNLFITPDSLDNGILATLWNKIQLANKEEVVIKALQILEPRAKNLGFLLPEMNGRYVRPLSGVMLGIDGHGKKVPLGSFGDGMKRLLAIVLALTCAKGGALFIDEIDAGFHYSVMKDLWNLVISTAQQNEIQVFVTTHSLDCLRGLSVLKDMHTQRNGLVSMYAIRDDMDSAIFYSADEIERIIEDEIEVR